MDGSWISAFPLAELSVGGARVAHGPVPIAVFRLEEQTLYAVDNRCPHEGYPLVQGSVSGCVLTCKWHNFKFDLRDGACRQGEEDVRSWPVRVVDGVVQIDVAPPAALVTKLWEDLDKALVRQETGRAARDVVRLLDLGVPPARIALRGALFDAARAEYGPSHALAAAAEVTARLTPGVEPALPLVQALDLAARSNLGLPVRPTPAPIDPGPDPAAAGARLRAHVEAEEGAEAEALVRGAVRWGWRRAELEPWFFQLCDDHFLDFGHALIYTTKIFDLLDATRWEGAEDLLGSFTWGFATGTREDLLPAWAGYRKEGEAPPTTADRLPPDALADAAPPAARALVRQNPAGALDALSIAAATRLLRFDPAHDRDPTVAEGWLDLTHRLTFAHAVRLASARWPVDRLARQAAQFIALARPLDGPAQPIEPATATLDEVVAAVAAREPSLALRRAAGWLQEGDAADLVDALERLIWSDHATRAIFLIHHLKTLRAGAAERIATGDDRPLLAAVRFLASPLRERSVERAVIDAVTLVREGRPPRKLTG